MINTSKWIKSPIDCGVAANSFKKNFTVSKKVICATLYVTALGIYAPHLNGVRVGKNVLAPGFYSYKNRALYQSYDVTSLIKEENSIDIGVGQGWAVGCIGYAVANHYFSDHTSLIACLALDYADGERELITTDESWEVYTTHVTSTEIYHGETVDLTAPITLIGNAVYDDISTPLYESSGELITEHERIAPVELIITPKGERVIDFGQNMTGYVEIRVKGERGERIVLHHAEVLDSDGNFYNENLRRARNENVYVLSGGDDIFKPTYSFQGFRYVRLNECPEHVGLECFTAIVVHSDIKRTCRFNCGNEKINQLYHNIIWGQKSNFLDVPTDCPQRDERLGWTGDAQVFCRTASINYDTEKFFTKWLEDVALEQSETGAVYGIVPDCIGKGRATRISAAWGDVACIMPWELYLAYGNRKLLKKHFPMMKKWVDYQRSAGPMPFLWLGGMHYGDWLAMDAGEDSYVGATSNDLIASAFFAHSTSLLIKAGEVIGEDVSEYRTLYNGVVAAFRGYFMKNGMPREEFPYTEVPPGKHAPVDTVRRGMTQCALVLILHFGLCTDEERPALVDKLVSMISDNGGKMSTGFVGTPYILHALTDNGRSDVAYSLLMQEENPSWLYSVNHGATTMWEHWNSLKEDGSFWSKDMNSFNHYAYGAVFDWIFGKAMGIMPKADSPAYKRIDIAPHPDRALGYAEAIYNSRQGEIRVHWYYKGEKVYYEISIPDGVEADILLPSGYKTTVGAGDYHFVD